MSRKCTTCQHLKRAEVDRRLAAGEPASQIAKDYGINPSSLHRHRANCLKLASSSAIMKEASRGTAAVASLPSKDELSSGYANLLAQIDEIVAQAKTEGGGRCCLQASHEVVIFSHMIHDFGHANQWLLPLGHMKLGKLCSPREFACRSRVMCGCSDFARRWLESYVPD